MKKSSGFYPPVWVDAAGAGVVSQSGAVLLLQTLGKVGLDRALSTALAPWRKPTARHDPAKIVLDLALALALGGDCLADVALLREQPGVFGPVASDPTVSRTIDALAADAARALKAINSARAAARAHAWRRAGEHAPDRGASADAPLAIDVDATLITAHSDKEHAAPTFKRGFGHHRLWVFADHGPDGTGEPLAVMLRPGNAGSNTATEHIAVVREALKQLPGSRRGKHLLIRADGAGATHEFLHWLTARRLSYSVGFTLPDTFADMLAKTPKKGWTPAYDGDGLPRDGAWVADVTGLLDLKSWPKGMRVIVRKERPHPGAQLRLTDPDGMRVTAPSPPTPPGASSPTWNCGTGAGHAARPHPLRERHRTDQPAAARVRAEPDLVRHRRTRLRTDHVDADTRPHRPSGPPLGTETPTTAAVQHRRPPRSQRPARLACTCPATPPGPGSHSMHSPRSRPIPRPAERGHPSQRSRTTPARGTGANPSGIGPERHTHNAESATGSGNNTEMINANSRMKDLG